MSDFDNCQHVFVADPGNRLVTCCERCGLIDSEARLRHDEPPSAQSRGQFIHTLAARQSGAGLVGSATDFGIRASGLERLRLRVQPVLLQASDELRLSAALTAQVTHLLHDLIHRKLWAGRSIDVVVAASAYVVLRRDGAPRTLRDVAHTLAVDEDLVSRMYKRIVALLGLEVPLVDAASFAELAAARLPLPPARQRAVLGLTTRILALCQTTALWGTGRRPEPLVAAAMLVAIDAERLEASVTPEQVYEACSAAPGTAKDRSTELRTQILAWADAYCTWIDRPIRRYNALVPTLSTLIRQTEMLTQLAAVVESDADVGVVTRLFDDEAELADDDDVAAAAAAEPALPNTDPPAFTKSAHKTDRLLALIVRTKLQMARDGVAKEKLELSELELPFADDGAKAHLLDPLQQFGERDQRDCDVIRQLVLANVPVRDMLEIGDLRRLLPLSRPVADFGDLDATQITGAEMPDSELANYLRSEAEVAEQERKRARVAEPADDAAKTKRP